MVELLKPVRGGFLRPFGCGWFIREFLLGNEPYGSPAIDPDIGAPQADIFHHYKVALMKATAVDRATRVEEKRSRREKRPINPDNIESLAERYLGRMSYKALLVGSCSTGNENPSQFLFGAFRSSYHGYFLNLDLLLSIRLCSSLLSTFQRLTRRSLPLRLPCPSCNALQFTQRAASGRASSRAGFIGCSQLSQSPYVPSSSFCKACSS